VTSQISTKGFAFGVCGFGGSIDGFTLTQNARVLGEVKIREDEEMELFQALGFL
jgi:hypothetical protein